MIVLDTHVLIWWLLDVKKLSKRALESIEKAEKEKQLFISTITVWELAMLAKKGRLQLNGKTRDFVGQIAKIPSLKILDISSRIALESVLLDYPHPDPADRIIIASAKFLGMPLISKDRKIRSFKEIETIW